MQKTVISYTIFTILMVLLVAPIPPSSVVAIILLKNNRVRSYLVGWQLNVANVADHTIKWTVRTLVYSMIVFTPQKKVTEFVHNRIENNSVITQTI